MNQLFYRLIGTPLILGVPFLTIHLSSSQNPAEQVIQATIMTFFSFMFFALGDSFLNQTQV